MWLLLKTKDRKTTMTTIKTKTKQQKQKQLQQQKQQQQQQQQTTIERNCLIPLFPQLVYVQLFPSSLTKYRIYRMWVSL